MRTGTVLHFLGLKPKALKCLAHSRPSLNISGMPDSIFDFIIINSVIVSLPNYSPYTTPFCFLKQFFQSLMPQVLEIIVKTPSF